MDSDPYSSNSFIETSRIEPFISFKTEDSVKIFETIFLNDESETIVFSSASFTENYDFLNGTIDTLSMKSSEYMAVKKALKDGLDINDLRYYVPKFAFKMDLFVTPDNALFFGDGKEIPYHSLMLEDVVLEDLKPISKIDRINSYIMNYNKRLSTSVFRSIEADEIRRNIRVIGKSKQKVKTA